MSKTIFWNVDTQYDFMRDDENYHGRLPLPGAKEIEKNLKKLTKFAHRKKIQIVSTGDWHTLNSKEISKNPEPPKTFPPHCLQFSKGADFIPATQYKDPYIVSWDDACIDMDKLRSHKGEIIIYKDAFDVFQGSPYTMKIIEMLNPDNVFIYGVAADVCVDFAVNGFLNIRDEGKSIGVHVVEDAIKGLPGSDLEKILAEWEARGAILVKTKEIGTYLKN